MNSALLNELESILPNTLRADRLRLTENLQRLRQHHSSPATESHLARLLEIARKSVALRHRRYESLPQISYPPQLPITARKDEIVSAIKANQVVVIAGETGSGKTTQIPKMCLEAGLGVEGKIGCTQPRRVAALSISRRLAEELNVTAGREVGCKIRFSDRSSPETYVKLMTDGILLAETQGDPDLNEYDAIVIDEAHERSLNIDFLLGHLHAVLKRRPELKLIITSATIDTESFARAYNAPVIEVSGRVYPVEVRYSPFDPADEEAGNYTYVDAAANAVTDLFSESGAGDVLVFMPGERDIRETQDLLQGRFSGFADVIPLYSRLASVEQERIFSTSQRRKVIVATNIAETSLTIPGIRFVVDAGLARMSRYSPRTRTKRLPIEAISQSSANQRAGRCGRVENGTCVRLYSLEDYEARPKFTQPEIQRANLGEVILRMKAWRLGDIESFPFINPPTPQAISAGYELLRELGALDEERALTDLGRDLARLPVDPAIGRMVLQSEAEGALEEMLVIGAGLSIQDPRERPSDKQEAADYAHAQFRDPDSDFLTLLSIWNAFHDRLEAFRTQSQMRRFCKANFLSYTRMREWIDIHSQLEQTVHQVLDRPHGRHLPAPRSASTLEEQRRKEGKPLSPKFVSIHRSILSGLLGHVAHREERNFYKASRNREVMIFPGSSLFDRTDKKGKGSGAGPSAKISQPEWIVAGEIVETSQLYARTVAQIDPEWIVDLGAHICKITHTDPHWDRELGRVLVHEKISLYGLEVTDRWIDYGRVNPVDATRLFIRSALVEEEIDTPHGFLQHNQRLRAKMELMRTRSRDHSSRDLEQAMFEFYAKRIETVSSVHDLNRLLRTQKDPQFLFVTEEDLTSGEGFGWDAGAFPPRIRLAGVEVEVDYAYAPGEERDGITIKLPATLAPHVEPPMLDWIIPGLREEQIEFLLKSLPKSLRVPLIPIPPKVKDLAAALKPGDDLDRLRQLVHQLYGVEIPRGTWTREGLPDYLRPRLALLGGNQKVVTTSRDVSALKQQLEEHKTRNEEDIWARAVLEREKYDLREWSFPDQPERIEVAKIRGVPLLAFPGLALEEGRVDLKLFRTLDDAARATPAGFSRLVELGLNRQMGWVQKDLRSLEKHPALYQDFVSSDELISSAYEQLKLQVIVLPNPILPLQKGKFEETIRKATPSILELSQKMLALIVQILEARKAVIAHKAFPKNSTAKMGAVSLPQTGSTGLKSLSALSAIPAAKPAVTPAPPGAKPAAKVSALETELHNLVPKDFLARTPPDKLQHLPRYLKALLLRTERAALNPLKDLERQRQVQPYIDQLKVLSGPKLTAAAAHGLRDFRWMLEEFKVSIFAQELGTAQPVSPKRLDALLESIKNS